MEVCNFYILCSMINVVDFLFFLFFSLLPSSAAATHLLYILVWVTIQTTIHATTAHSPGLVPIRVYSNGKQISSNSMVFEYKADLRLNMVPVPPTDTSLKLCLIHRMECLEKCFRNFKVRIQKKIKKRKKTFSFFIFFTYLLSVYVWIVLLPRFCI